MVEARGATVCFAYYWLVDRCLWQQYPTSPLCEKNLPLATFSSSQTLSGSTPRSKNKKEQIPCGIAPFLFGGGEGSRTPVRKPIPTDISERRRSLTFPHTKAGRHAFVLSSRKFMTRLSALPCSRSPLIDALAGPRYYRVGRLLN